MKRRTWLLGGASAIALSATVQSVAAADLPRAAPAVTSAFSWTSIYIGAVAGASLSQNRYDFAGIANSGTFFGNGALLGGLVGVNFQTGHLVYGLEGDGAWANVRGGNACFPASGLACQVESGGLFTLRGRIGLTIGGMPQPISLTGYVPQTNRWNDMLLYVTAGGAARTIHAVIPGTGQSDTTKIGWAVGGGLEVPITNNVTGRVEYLFADYRDFNCAPGCTGGIPINTTVNMKENLFRTVLTYKF